MRNISELFPLYKTEFYEKGRMALEDYLTDFKNSSMYFEIPSLTCKAIPNAFIKKGIKFNYYNISKDRLQGEFRDKSPDGAMIQGILGILPHYSAIESLLNSDSKVILDLSQCLFISEDYYQNIEKFDFIFTSLQMNKPLGDRGAYGGIGFFKKDSVTREYQMSNEALLKLKTALIKVLPNNFLHSFNEFIMKDDFFIDKNPIRKIKEKEIISSEYYDYKYKDKFYEVLGSNTLSLKNIDWCGHYLPVYVKNKEDFKKVAQDISYYNWPIRILSPFKGELKELGFPENQIDSAEYFSNHLLGILIPENEGEKSKLLSFVKQNKSLFV